ncbi:ketoacyl-ACP synthase III family protein [Streptomyces aidingensis]|uniref:3-oxoacyl-[acyl-carrier-protein] synthase-3 n=1 Tax=Streptomyces aidingensis TaxID=910347 RepID=A0A1I1QZP8_9ACTN|nr:ketoacyl-ACP synthase III family protein [Streptomyces aidingensis]SFD27604.1 3-oxoacyl-[acyl-carrier-protein] synthase-3 [Streptomyces aidingensis]
MRWENVHVAGVGVYLPEEVQTAEQAVAEGRYDATAAAVNGVRAVRVAGPGETGPVMAAEAGRQALARSGHAPQDIDLVLHACTSHQGRDLWTPAHFVQREVLGTHASAAIELRQGCNGVLSGLELAASWAASRPGSGAALVTCGDAWHLPYVDRWTSDDQTVFGDGGSAVVLSARGGFARLLATVSRSDASLEPLYRGMGPWDETPFPDGKPVRLGDRPGEWLLRDKVAYDDVLATVAGNFDETLRQVLEESGTGLHDARWFVHASMIRPIAEWGFGKRLGLDPARTTYEWSLDFGHVGSSDQLMGINHLAETGRLSPGDRVITVGAGTGFMWTAAVLEIEHTPDWP